MISRILNSTGHAIPIAKAEHQFAYFLQASKKGVLVCRLFIEQRSMEIHFGRGGPKAREATIPLLISHAISALSDFERMCAEGVNEAISTL